MIIKKLNDIINHYDSTDIDYSIAKYIKNHLEIMHKMKIEDIAKECHVSIGKISSFTRKLGYNSYQELKQSCDISNNFNKHIVNHRDEDLYTNIDNSLIKIREALHSISIECINQLVDKIRKNSTIYIYGTGYCSLLCEYFQRELELYHKEVIIIDQKTIIPNNSFIIIFSINGKILTEQFTKKLLLLNPYIICSIPTNKKIEICGEIHSLNYRQRRIFVRYLIDIIINQYELFHKS